MVSPFKTIFKTDNVAAQCYSEILTDSSKSCFLTGRQNVRIQNSHQLIEK